MKYIVTAYQSVSTIDRVYCTVEADSEKEAIEKVTDGDSLDIEVGKSYGCDFDGWVDIDEWTVEPDMQPQAELSL